jgi:hypothetical protein
MSLLVPLLTHAFASTRITPPRLNTGAPRAASTAPATPTTTATTTALAPSFGSADARRFVVGRCVIPCSATNIASGVATIPGGRLTHLGAGGKLAPIRRCGGGVSAHSAGRLLTGHARIVRSAATSAATTATTAAATAALTAGLADRLIAPVPRTFGLAATGRRYR